MTRRRQLRVVLAAIAIAAAVNIAIAFAKASTSPERRTQQVTYQGRPILWWARHAVAARRAANARLLVIRAQRAGFLRNSGPVYEHAARLAAIAYGVDADTLIRKGRCESVNWTQFVNTSSSARGPWQFLTTGRVRRYGDGAFVDGGTWATTPYWAFSPFDPLAAALAAAWMHERGRGGEWVCR